MVERRNTADRTPSPDETRELDSDSEEEEYKIEQKNH